MTDNTKPRRNIVLVHRKRKIIVIAAVVLILTIILLIPSIRSKRSETEKRELAQFPKLTFAALFSGSYFDDITTWFADTVPSRDTLSSAGMKIQNALGTAGVQAGFNDGNSAGEIPTASGVIEDDTTVQAPVTTLPGEVTTVAPETTVPETTTEEEEFTGISEQLGSIFLADNAAFEYYNFVQSTADTYIKAINRAGNALQGKSNVYCMIVPLSTDVTLNSKLRSKLNVSDQRQATDYMFGSMNENVKKIEVLNTLRAHKDEYIYFRTDHHWTGLGAYYAYREYCASAGINPLELSQYTKKSFPGFLGTFYNDSGQSPALGATPDTVDTYAPPCEVSMMVTDQSGSTYSMPLIYDESNSTPSVKYSAFISGDNTFSVITNESVENGPVCVVVKESFGNALVPLLAVHYKTVYVIDYRFWTGSITQFAAEKGARDLIFCNNISMTRSESLVNALNAKI